MKKIGIYPGNFQPALISHYNVYKALKSVVGDSDVFIATTDREPSPDAPLNFGDKEQIWVRHGVPASHIIRVNSLPTDNVENAHDWKPNEIFHKFSSKHTVAIIALNSKDAELFSKIKDKVVDPEGMSAGGLSDKTKKELNEIYKELCPIKEQTPEEEDPEDADLKNTLPKNREVWLKQDGELQYFQPYKSNEHALRPFSEHVYIIIIDDTKVQGKPMSTANIRSILGSDTLDDYEKKKTFRWAFGWFDVGLYQLLTFKFKNAHQVSSTEQTPNVTNVNSNQPRRPVSAYNQQPNSGGYTQNGKLQEIVKNILKKLSEDMTSNSNNLNTGMASSLDIEKESPAKQSANAAKQRIDLVKQKKELEATAKQNKQKSDAYSTEVKNYNSFQKKADRDSIDSINKQLSQPSKIISPIK